MNLADCTVSLVKNNTFSPFVKHLLCWNTTECWKTTLWWEYLEEEAVFVFLGIPWMFELLSHYGLSLTDKNYEEQILCNECLLIYAHLSNPYVYNHLLLSYCKYLSFPQVSCIYNLQGENNLKEKEPRVHCTRTEWFIFIFALACVKLYISLYLVLFYK